MSRGIIQMEDVARSSIKRPCHILHRDQHVAKKCKVCKGR